jgi:hypothetical protein
LKDLPLYPIGDSWKGSIQIAENLRELYIIIGPELKSVTNNPRVIHDTRRDVDKFIKQLELLSFF